MVWLLHEGTCLQKHNRISKSGGSEFTQLDIVKSTQESTVLLVEPFPPKKVCKPKELRKWIRFCEQTRLRNRPTSKTLLCISHLDIFISEASDGKDTPGRSGFVPLDVHRGVSQERDCDAIPQCYQSLSEARAPDPTEIH